MSATAEDVRQWIVYGKQKKATHIISVCDTFDFEDYPVYINVHRGDDLHKTIAKYDGGNMQRVNEIITLEDYNKNGELDI